MKQTNDASRHVLLTYGLGLPVQVVKQLSVAGEHAATRGTGYQPLLSVAPHVFSQTVPDLEESITAWNKNIIHIYTEVTVRACYSD